MAVTTRTVLPQTVRDLFQSLAVPGSTDPVLLSGVIAMQITGPATAMSVVVERSTVDPATGSPNWAPADSAPLTGNPTAGLPPVAYREAGAAWWRVRATSITGARLDISIQGKGA